MGYWSMCLVTLWSVDYVMECAGCCRMYLFAPRHATHGILRRLSPRECVDSLLGRDSPLVLARRRRTVVALASFCSSALRGVYSLRPGR